MKKILQPNIIFIIGFVLYVASFFLPTLNLSLGITLSGWEAMLLHFSEFAFLDNIGQYFAFLWTALTNFWVVGLIVGFIIGRNTLFLIILSILALLSSLSWFLLLAHSSVLILGYYTWIIGIILIIISRFLKKEEFIIS